MGVQSPKKSGLPRTIENMRVKGERCEMSLHHPFWLWAFNVKSRVKTRQVRGIWSQQLVDKQVPKRGTEQAKGKYRGVFEFQRCTKVVRCPEGEAFPAGMPQPLQMFDGNHS